MVLGFGVGMKRIQEVLGNLELNRMWVIGVLAWVSSSAGWHRKRTKTA